MYRKTATIGCGSGPAIYVQLLFLTSTIYFQLAFVPGGRSINFLPSQIPEHRSNSWTASANLN
jgi:hypothetical protein